jgi:3'-phosphoadenosine 5'-phosphosulfate sulfotransferase (PAPS reductase)/FAD synthetase
MPPPDLRAYDYILINSSAGKDSQAMLDLVVELADAAGVRDRVVVVHCDLGRVEWSGTRELAEEQAAHYGLRFEVVSRRQGDLLTQVDQRAAAQAAKGKRVLPWPSPRERWCTSDQKRAPVYALMTRLAADWRANIGQWDACKRKRPCRILNCQGMRAQESSARAKLVPFHHDEKASNGRRHVDKWLPIHGWTVEEVWSRIRASGVRHHRAYDLGMSRLSCVFCIFAPEPALMIAGEHNPALLDEYIAREERHGATFKPDLALVQIRKRLADGERVAPASARDGGCWNM